MSLLPPLLLPTLTVETVYVNLLSSVHSYPSASRANSKPGRPPQAPGAAFQQPLRKDSRGQFSSNQHKQATSTGEFSFLSALMEPSNSDDQWDRAVTWDENLLDVSPAAEDKLASLGMLQQAAYFDG
jgi:hypothetical protein